MHFLHLAKITMIAIAFLKTPPTHITKLIHISVASQIYQLEASASAFFSLCQSYDDWFNLSKASLEALGERGDIFLSPETKALPLPELCVHGTSQEM